MRPSLAFSLVALLSCLLLTGLPAHGQAPAASRSVLLLDQATVGVTDRSAAVRQQAAVQALDQVLLRRLGRRDRLEGARALLGPAEQYVNRYAYHESDGQLLLTFYLDGEPLDAALLAHQVPQWPASRPPLQVWATAERGDLHGLSDGGELARALDAAARERGLPLLWPALDETDRRAVGAADLRGRFDQPLRQAARRYGTGPVLSLVHSQYPLRLRWRLLLDGEPAQGGELSGGTLEERVAELVDQVVTPLVDHYGWTPAGGADQWALLDVRGLRTVQDWERLRAWLGEQPGLTQLAPERVQGDRVRWRVRHAGDAASLQRTLTVSGLLRACGDTGAQDAPLSLCWHP